MNFSKIFLTGTAILALGASVPALAAGDYSVVDILNKENEKRQASADFKFYEAPRDSTAFASFSAMRVVDMGAMTRGCTGWAAALGAAMQLNADNHPELKFLVGGEIFLAYAEGSYNARDIDFESANIVFNAGIAYDFNRSFSAGILLGYTPLGFSTYKRDGDNTHACLTSLYSIRPYCEFHVNSHSAFYVSYRWSYITAGVLGYWMNIESSSGALEVGYRLRF